MVMYEAEYEQILARPRKNPEWVESLLAKSPEELKQSTKINYTSDLQALKTCNFFIVIDPFFYSKYFYHFGITGF